MRAPRQGRDAFQSENNTIGALVVAIAETLEKAGGIDRDGIKAEGVEIGI